jgi:O-acetyl-ADP-ribose deacetylase (regulator of RNase III)
MTMATSEMRESEAIGMVGRCAVRLIRGDITELDVVAFVFYARSNLALGSGFGNAISNRGGAGIKAEIEKLAPVPLTEAVVTSAGKLKARHIVHAVGPSFQEEGLDAKLRQTVLNSLKRAEEKGIRQIALPAMGAGFYGIPLPSCVDLMVGTLREYLQGETNLDEVILCANDEREYQAFKSGLQLLARHSFPPAP